MRDFHFILFKRMNEEWIITEFIVIHDEKLYLLQLILALTPRHHLI